MSEYKEGQIIEGTVSGIQSYGAFISLNDKEQGLIHISEITNGYVRDISDFIKIGDSVQVCVLSISEEDGKIALSLRRQGANFNFYRGNRLTNSYGRSKPLETKSGFAPLKEKLPKWLEEFNIKKG